MTAIDRRRVLAETERLRTAARSGDLPMGIGESARSLIQDQLDRARELVEGVLARSGRTELDPKALEFGTVHGGLGLDLVTRLSSALANDLRASLPADRFSPFDPDWDENPRLLNAATQADKLAQDQALNDLGNAYKEAVQLELLVHEVVERSGGTLVDAWERISLAIVACFATVPERPIVADSNGRSTPATASSPTAQYNAAFEPIAKLIGDAVQSGRLDPLTEAEATALLRMHSEWQRALPDDLELQALLEQRLARVLLKVLPPVGDSPSPLETASRAAVEAASVGEADENVLAIVEAAIDQAAPSPPKGLGERIDIALDNVEPWAERMTRVAKLGGMFMAPVAAAAGVVTVVGGWTWMPATVRWVYASLRLRHPHLPPWP